MIRFMRDFSDLKETVAALLDRLEKVEAELTAIKEKQNAPKQRRNTKGSRAESD